MTMLLSTIQVVEYNTAKKGYFYDYSTSKPESLSGEFYINGLYEGTTLGGIAEPEESQIGIAIETKLEYSDTYNIRVKLNFKKDYRSLGLFVLFLHDNVKTYDSSRDSYTFDHVATQVYQSKDDFAFSPTKGELHRDYGYSGYAKGVKIVVVLVQNSNSERTYLNSQRVKLGESKDFDYY